jgi:hypothetical protein
MSLLPQRLGGETERHRSLKALAGDWAREQGLSLVSEEVSFPHNRFRVDVAAFRPKHKVPSKVRLQESLGVSAVFECKQSRADFIKDIKDREALKARLVDLLQRKTRLEKLLQIHFPNLARREELFPEFDSYDYDGCGHGGHRQVTRKIQELQRAVVQGTKFHRLIRYGLAHLHYIVAEPGILESWEVPVGWGLLVREGTTLRLEVEPAHRTTTIETQIIFLQRLGFAGNAKRKTNQVSRAEVNSAQLTRERSL